MIYGCCEFCLVLFLVILFYTCKTWYLKQHWSWKLFLPFFSQSLLFVTVLLRVLYVTDIILSFTDLRVLFVTDLMSVLFVTDPLHVLFFITGVLSVLFVTDLVFAVYESIMLQIFCVCRLQKSFFRRSHTFVIWENNFLLQIFVFAVGESPLCHRS